MPYQDKLDKWLDADMKVKQDNAALLRASFAERTPATCPTKTPEVHLLGEFPMSCHNCHIEADS